MLTHCRTIVCAGVLLAAACVPASAQPAFDAASNAVMAGGTTRTWSHTASGADRYLLVASCIYTPATETTTGVTFNGVALTQVRANADVAGPELGLSVWELIAPGAVTADVVITASASTDISGAALSFTGANQTNPSTNDNGATGTGVTPSVTVTSATGNRVGGFACWNNTGSNPAASGADQTERIDQVSGLYDLTASDEAGSASVTHSYTITPSTEWSIIGVDIDESSGAPPAAPAAPKLPLLGVGRGAAAAW